MPVRMRVIENLERNRLTVFFRFILALPHLIWLGLWSIGAALVAFIAWFVVLFRRQMPDGMHNFFTMYVRYFVHVQAYLNLAANPYPGFLGQDSYEVDLEFDPPALQNRWKTGFRIILALPALLLASALGGSIGGSFGSDADRAAGHGATGSGFQAGGVLLTCAFLLWFYALVKGRAPEGIARLQWYCLHYSAQAAAYFLLVTDRYPTSDPERVGIPWPAPEHTIRLNHEAEGGRRSRLTVFFRLLLAVPHFVWLLLWGIAAVFVALVNWIVTLVRGRSPGALHNFLSAYVRYETHVVAFAAVIANPFPGFGGSRGSYPVDVDIDPPARQNRWTVGFRIFLAIPALILSSALSTVLWLAAVLGWFASLFTAHMPSGLRKLGLLSLRYSAQTNAYALLLTNRYPYAGPPA